ncbi:VOC family protein [Spirillospora sp. NPDC049652]
MGQLKHVHTVIYPARALAAGTAAWTAILGGGPAWESPDFVTFITGDIEIGLSRLPWFDHPLVFWQVDDIVYAHRELLDAGATALGEVVGGSMAELGTAPVVNGDPATGIVDVPGRRLAVLKTADGNPIGLLQNLPAAW